jgi:hypothetical protein
MLNQLAQLDPSMPVVWHDKRGLIVAKAVIGAFPGIKVTHKGWPVKRGDEWLRGSHLCVESVCNEESRDAILKFVKEAVRDESRFPVKLEFVGSNLAFFRVHRG